jgi:glycosyltransferase involved in cell wall biosynthesis
MRIMFLASDRVACGIVRADVPARAINRAGDNVAWVQTSPWVSDYVAADAMVFQRPSEPQHLAWMASAKDRMLGRIVDFDDDLWAVPPACSGAHEHYADPERRRRMDEALLAAGLVTVSNEVMLDVVRERTDRPAMIVPNSVDCGQARLASRRRPQNDESVVIGWMGSKVHSGDVHLVDAALARVAAERPAVRLDFRGSFAPEMFTALAAAPVGNRVSFRGWIAPEALYDELAQWDVGLCPLDAQPFNRAKSEIKWAELGAVGVPAVVSDFGPYKALPSGLVVRVPEGTPTAWADALMAMVDDCALRRRVGDAAQQAVERDYSSEKRARLWLDAARVARRLG